MEAKVEEANQRAQLMKQATAKAAAKAAEASTRVAKLSVGKAQAAAETDGFIKLLFGEEHGELLGAHIIGANATDLIAEMGLGLTLEATIEDFHATIHAHPTLTEGVHEASLDAEGHAIHF